MFNKANITALQSFLTRNYFGNGTLLTEHQIAIHAHTNHDQVNDRVSLSWFIGSQHIVNATAPNLYLAVRLLLAKLDAKQHNLHPIEEIHDEL